MDRVAAPDTNLILIRHGESRAQVDGFMSGHDTCTGLSEQGRRQVAALRDRLEQTRELADVAIVYTSILRRSVETAEIIGPALGGIEPRPECDWCEIHAGSAEGLTRAELRARYPLFAEPGNPFRSEVPDAESWSEFSARVGTRLHRVADEHPGQRIVVVGHGGTIAASFVALTNLSMVDALNLTTETANTSITEWIGSGAEWRLVRFNDAAHLRAIQ